MMTGELSLRKYDGQDPYILVIKPYADFEVTSNIAVLDALQMWKLLRT